MGEGGTSVDLQCLLLVASRKESYCSINWQVCDFLHTSHTCVPSFISSTFLDYTITGNCRIFATCKTEKRIANHIRVYHVHQSEWVTCCKDSAIFCSVTHSKGSDWWTWPALVYPLQGFRNLLQHCTHPYMVRYTLFGFTRCKDSAIFPVCYF